MRVDILPSSLKDTLKSETSYRILILSDLHIPIDMDLKEIIITSEIIKKIDYVIFLGDNVACYGNEHEYKMLNEFIKKLKKPYTAINGNHEFMFEVYEYDSENYGKLWNRAGEKERKKQLEKFCNFFNIKTPFWSEKIENILYIFFLIGDYKKEKIEVLPEKSEEFFIKEIKNKKDIEKIFVFCHAPLKGSEIGGFKYYDENGDPFIYLKEETLNTIEKIKIPIYWVSGHIHLNPLHPMAVVRKVRKNLYQVNCPPSWKFSRKSLEDIIPQKYEDFYSLILKVHNGTPDITLHNWLSHSNLRG